MPIFGDEFTLILYMRKLRLQMAQDLTKGHTSGQWPSQKSSIFWWPPNLRSFHWSNPLCQSFCGKTQWIAVYLCWRDSKKYLPNEKLVSFLSLCSPRKGANSETIFLLPAIPLHPFSPTFSIGFPMEH